MKTLYMMCGIPGSGKSWYANRLIESKNEDWAYVSRDNIRFNLLEEGQDYFEQEHEVFQKFTDFLVSYLENKDTPNVIADATHLNWRSRHKLIQALQLKTDMSCVRVIPVVVTCSLETALARNSERTGRAFVPKGVIRRMSHQMTNPKDDPFKYDGIIRVTNEEEIRVEYEFT